MIPATERSSHIDLLRGIALVGIILVNFQSFLFPLFETNTGPAARPDTIDQCASFLVSWLIAGKFVIVFAFLFGWGLGVQMHRQHRSTAAIARRLLALAVLGVLNAVLLYYGDILTSYAVAGSIMLGLRNCPARIKVKCMIVLGLAIAVFSTIYAIGLLFTPDLAFDAAHQDKIVAPPPPSPPETYLEVLIARTKELRAVAVNLAFLFPSVLFAVFAGDLLALACPGSDMSAWLELRRPAHALVRRWSAPALVMNAFMALPAFGVFDTGGQSVAAAIEFALDGPASLLLAFVYLAAALIVVSRMPDGWLTRLIEASGRSSLSVYFGQNLTLGLIFHRYGWDLAATATFLKGLVVSLGAHALLVAMAAAWLIFCEVGPLEWLVGSFVAARPIKLWRSRSVAR